MIAEPQKVKSEKSLVAEICDWYTVELMVVVVGQEAGGVSQAAGGSCSSLHMCTRQLVALPQERGPPCLGQDPRNNASLAGWWA